MADVSSSAKPRLGRQGERSTYVTCPSGGIATTCLLRSSTTVHFKFGAKRKMIGGGADVLSVGHYRARGQSWRERLGNEDVIKTYVRLPCGKRQPRVCFIQQPVPVDISGAEHDGNRLPANASAA